MANATLFAQAGTISLFLPVSAPLNDLTAQNALNALNALVAQVSTGSLNLKIFDPNASVSTVPGTVPRRYRRRSRSTAPSPRR